MIRTDKKILIIAHRGASHYAPENTMAAFQLAHEMKADMIELDVQLSKDGIPVVFHDAKLNNHSNGKGLVSAFTFNELYQLDAGKWFYIEFTGEKIPSLREVLTWAKGRIDVNIEIKKESVTDQISNGIEEKVIELVENFKMAHHTIISSFDYRAVQRVQMLMPEVATGLLYHKKRSDKRMPVELMEQYGATLFHCSRSEMKKNWLHQLQEAGKKFLIYTVNKEKDMVKWIEKGAFGIFSDKPDLLRNIANRYVSKSA